VCVSVCVLSRLEGITNGRRAASKSKSGSGARWAVSSLRDWVKRRSTCANGGFDTDNDRETDSVRGYVGRFNESNVSRRTHSKRVCELARSLFDVLASTRHEIRGDFEKIKSSCPSVLLEDPLSMYFICPSTYNAVLYLIWQCVSSGEATIGSCIGVRKQSSIVLVNLQ
jgi:hypothetical protein